MPTLRKTLTLALLLLTSLCAMSSPRAPLIFGLNPALQKSISFAQLIPGTVNRGLSCGDGIGGKGQNVAVAASYMGIRDFNVCMLLGSGAVGDQLGALIETTVQIDVLTSPLTVRTHGKCRTCVSLVDNSKNETTEVIEPSETILSEEIDVLLENVRQFYSQQKASGVAVMGSMPPGCPSSLYGSLLTRACDSHSKVLLDTVNGLREALEACGSIDCRPFVKVGLKYNTFEGNLLFH